MIIKKITTVLLGALMALMVTHVLALPAEIEADRLVLAAEQKISAQDYEAARRYLERIVELKVTAQPKFHFLAGQVALHYSELEKASESLSQYVEEAGRDAEFYESSLKMITKIEEQLNAQDAASRSLESVMAIKADKGALIEDTAGKVYDAKVQKLYIGKNLKEALIIHINSILKSYVYMEGKIKNLETSNREEFTVSLKPPAQILVSKRENKPSQGAQSAITMSNLDTFGVNPFVQYRCSKATDACVIKHPVHGGQWMKMAYNEAAADDLTKALTRLCKALQR